MGWSFVDFGLSALALVASAIWECESIRDVII